MCVSVVCSVDVSDFTDVVVCGAETSTHNMKHQHRITEILSWSEAQKNLPIVMS